LIQFTKVANIAWLIVGILNAFKQFSINSPIVVVIVLSIIVGIGVIKEGVTDYSRHQSDKKMNATPVKKIGTLEKGPNHIVNI
jgi:phospholipid-translocating ATPase